MKPIYNDLLSLGNRHFHHLRHEVMRRTLKKILEGVSFVKFLGG
jgi:hypothetical protein